MVADAVNDHHPHVRRNGREALVERQYGRVIERVALGRAVQSDGEDAADPVDAERRGGIGDPGRGVSHGDLISF
jgi:hypothetical protein